MMRSQIPCGLEQKGKELIVTLSMFSVMKGLFCGYICAVYKNKSIFKYFINYATTESYILNTCFKCSIK